MTQHSISNFPEIDRAERLARRLGAAKRAFTTRHVDLSAACRLVRSGIMPRAGDVVLARVETIGQHAKLENVHGRRGTLYTGDEIIVAFGNRYAPDQFEAYVPETLGPCDLVAGGGVASRMTVKHASMKPPTRIDVIGILAREDGTALNLFDFAAARDQQFGRPSLTIAVVGSSMNAGKTTTAAGLVRGLTLAGFRVGAAKITGTGSGGDLWTMLDAGAAMACDFTDAGHTSTFCLRESQLEQVAARLLTRLSNNGVDIAIVEIADGLLQRETAAVLDAAIANTWFDGVVFAAADAMGAAFGVDWLAKRGISPLAVSGLVSASPLAAREASAVTGYDVATLTELRDPIAVTKLVFSETPQARKAA
jgi:hypothetical protein